MLNPEKKSRYIQLTIFFSSLLFFLTSCASADTSLPEPERQQTTLIHACIDESFNPEAPTVCAPDATIVSNLPIRATLASGESTTINNATVFYYPAIISWSIDPEQVEEATGCSTFYSVPIYSEDSPDDLVEIHVVLADCDN